MGVTITATHRPYEFDMGYGGFFILRKNIAFALDEEFGENYALLSHCFTESQFSENDKVADKQSKIRISESIKAISVTASVLSHAEIPYKK